MANVEVTLRNPLHVLGLIAIGLGTGLLGVCIWEFARRGRGTLAPVDPPRKLVVRGPYRYVRNPMYLSVTSIVLGEILLTHSLALLAYWAVWFAVVNLMVIGYEEQTLRRQFGDSYLQYTRRVGRWIPTILVRADQTEEALRILDTRGPALPADFEVTENADAPTQKAAPDFATQLKNLQRTVRRLVIVSTILFFALWCFVAYLLTDRPSYSGRLWSSMAEAMRRSDFERARRIAQTAVKQYPREYWSHEWLGDVDVKLKDFASAEIEYQRAYDLLPSERIKKHLQDARIRKETNPQDTPGPH